MYSINSLDLIKKVIAKIKKSTGSSNNSKPVDAK